jgi:hypothetical protein
MRKKRIWCDICDQECRARSVFKARRLNPWPISMRDTSPADICWDCVGVIKKLREQQRKETP